jgi:hypothetical protein
MRRAIVSAEQFNVSSAALFSMKKYFASLTLLIALAIPVQFEAAALPEASAESSAPVKYQKTIASYIAAGVGSYPAAKKRYENGLPRTDRFYVVARLARGAGICAMAVVRVSGIDEQNGTVNGRIENEIDGRLGYHEKDEITVPESAVIDWKIAHSDGSVEGDVVGKFLNSSGAGAKASELLVDQRDLDLINLEKSQIVEDAINQTFLQLFDDKGIKVQATPSAIAPAIKEWPDLYRKYRDRTPDELIAELSARAAAIRATRKVTVELSGIDDKKIILVAAFVALKKGGSIFEIEQYLHFNYTGAKKLGGVIWGLREGRWLDSKPNTNQPPDRASSSVTTPAGASGAADH